MEKWILIIIQDRELMPISVYDTFDEAQAAMKADFIESVGEDEFNKACLANDDSQYWQLNDDNAWRSEKTNIDWFIERILVSPSTEQSDEGNEDDEGPEIHNYLRKEVGLFD